MEIETYIYQITIYRPHTTIYTSWCSRNTNIPFSCAANWTYEWANNPLTHTERPALLDLLWRNTLKPFVSQPHLALFLDGSVCAVRRFSREATQRLFGLVSERCCIFANHKTQVLYTSNGEMCVCVLQKKSAQRNSEINVECGAHGAGRYCRRACATCLQLS